MSDGPRRPGVGPRIVERVEDVHEAIDRLIDELDASRPAVDVDSFARLDGEIRIGLRRAYDELDALPADEDAWHARSITARHGELAPLLDDLRRKRPGSSRWWIRLDELSVRLRTLFAEVELELLTRVG